MEIRAVSSCSLSDAFVAFAEQFESYPGTPRECLDKVSRIYGNDEGTGAAIAERLIAFVFVTRERPMSDIVRAFGSPHEIPHAFLATAAGLPLWKGEKFDPEDFAEAALLAWPQEGEA